MTAGAGLMPSKAEEWATWARENAVTYGGLHRATAEAIRRAIAEDRATREASHG